MNDFGGVNMIDSAAIGRVLPIGRSATGGTGQGRFDEIMALQRGLGVQVASPVQQHVAEASATAGARDDAVLGAKQDQAEPRLVESRERLALRDAASKFVSSAFLLPMLAQVRESSFAAGPFAAGTGEKHFAPMLDQQIADRVMTAARLPIVDVLVDRLASVLPDKGMQEVDTHG